MLDAEAVRNATVLLKLLARAGQDAWDGAPEEDVVACLQAVAEAARVVDGLKVAAAGALERRSSNYTRAESLCSRLGYSAVRGAVADVFGVGFYQAKAWLDLAEDTATFTGSPGPRRPALAVALREGELSIEAARIIRDTLGEVTQESFRGGTLAAEATLVANATAGRVNLFRALMQRPRATDGDFPDENLGGSFELAAPSPGDGLGVGYWPVVPPRSSGDLASYSAEGESGAPGSAGSAGTPASGGAPGSLGTPGDAGMPGDEGRTSGDGRDSRGAFGGRGEAEPDAGLNALGGQPQAGEQAPVWRGAPRVGGGFQGAGTPLAGGRPSIKNVRQQAKGWGMILEPRKTELSHEAQHRARSFRMTPVETGGFKFDGFAPEVDGQAMMTLLDAYLSPRSAASRGTGGHADADMEPGDGISVSADRASTSAPDTRTRVQKGFDALAQIFKAQASAADAPQVAGAAPTLLITATLGALNAHLDRCCELEGADTAAARATDASMGTGVDAATATGAAMGAGADAATATGADASGEALQATAFATGAGLGSAPSGRGRRLSGGIERESGEGEAVFQLPLDLNGLPDADAIIDRRFARIGQEGTPVPISAVLHLLCDASMQVLLQDQEGVPLKLGRSKRLFSPHQRRVLASRDRHCRAPGCDIPAKWCEVHHVRPWEHGGATDIDNGILLCSFHHHEIDRGRLKIEEVPHTEAPFASRHRLTMPVLAASGSRAGTGPGAGGREGDGSSSGNGGRHGGGHSGRRGDSIRGGSGDGDSNRAGTGDGGSIRGGSGVGDSNRACNGDGDGDGNEARRVNAQGRAQAGAGERRRLAAPRATVACVSEGAGVACRISELESGTRTSRRSRPVIRI